MGLQVGHWRTAQGANIANADNTERPALAWLRTYVQSTVLGTAPAAISQQVSVFPNPAVDGSVSLALPAALRQQALEVFLFNTLGQTVLHQTLPASASAVRTMTLPSVPQGIYTVRLQTSLGTISKRLSVN